MIGIPKAWPYPAVLIKATLASKRSGTDKDLRAIDVSVNQAATDEGVCAIPNFRVPDGSIIKDVYAGRVSNAEAIEEMEEWVSSDGKKWSGGRFVVRATRIGDSVQAILARK